MSSRVKKWGIKTEDKPLYGVFLVSRNKDNKHLDSDLYKERKVAFVSSDLSKAKREFNHFCNDAIEGEKCRMYVSVNERDRTKTRKMLIHELVDAEDDFPLSNVQAKVCSCAMKHENAKTKYWMFDFDTKSQDKLCEFISDLEENGFSEYESFVESREEGNVPENAYYVEPTPHGYAIIVTHGFDTREILKNREDYVTLKRDDMLCYDWNFAD